MNRNAKEAPLAPAFVAAVNDGIAAHGAGRMDDAIAAFQKAAKLNPKHALPQNNLGSVLKAQHKLEESAAAFKRAIVLDPTMAMAYSNLGSVYTDMRKYDLAHEALGKALKIQPEYPEAYNNLATCFLDTGKIDEALAAVRKAIELKSEYPEAQSNLGAVLSAAGRTQEAVKAFERAVAIAPAMPMPHKNLGLALLRSGEFRRGWQEYEWRWRADGIPPRDYPLPLWQGQPLNGKTILLYTEQGLGDALQFARFVPVLAEQGARVILEVHKPLVPLMRNLKGVSQVVELGSPPPACDTYQAIMSLPHVMGINGSNVPVPIPYIEPDATKVASWRARLGSHGFKVGIVWEGKAETPSQRTRSTTLESFAGLAAIDGVRLISLQKGADISSASFKVESLGEDFDTGPGAFMDTAAVIRNLDLVVTIDTSVAHLAGALGAPVWIAIKLAPDWRWEDKGETNPWYPNARLFRQPAIGDWQGAFAAMVTALQDHLRNGAPLTLARPAATAAAAAAADSVMPAPAPRGPRPAGDFTRFIHFLNEVDNAYTPQLPIEPHVSITQSTIETLHKDGFLKAGDRVLDVNSSQGQALELFQSLGLQGKGLARGSDLEICKAKGLDVVDMDQNFMDFADSSFDVLWCRHSADASIVPMFTLSEYRRVTKPGGIIYVEVAAPETSAHHENDPNRYSALAKNAWMNLFARINCTVEKGWVINFNMSTGADAFWSFILRRPA